VCGVEELADLPQIDMLVSDEAHLQYAQLRPARLAISSNGFLSFLHYNDAFAALGNQHLRPMTLEGLDFAGVTDGPLRAFFEHILFTQEGLEHQRLRRLVASAFSPRTVNRLRLSVHDHLIDLLDPVVDRGRGDLVEEVCQPIAIVTLCDLLGLPREDIPSFQHWAGGMGLAFGLLSPEARQVVEKSLEGISEYAETLIERRRAEPADDLVSDLIRAEEEGERLSTEELSATVSNMLFAGYDTTYRQISLALLCLARNPGAWSSLTSDPTLAGACAEEVLRTEPIAHSTTRIAVADTEVNGIPLASGAMVEPMIAAANRDPSVFQDPDQFVPGRKGPKPLSFGQGIHTCLGAALARLEIAEAMVAVATRLRGWRVGIETSQVEWCPLSEPFRGVARLPVAAG
jgi:cytochrome P450